MSTGHERLRPKYCQSGDIFFSPADVHPRKKKIVRKNIFFPKKIEFQFSIFTHKTFDNDKFLVTRGAPTHKLLVSRFLADSGQVSQRGANWKFFSGLIQKYGGELVFAKKNANFKSLYTHKTFDDPRFFEFVITTYP